MLDNFIQKCINNFSEEMKIVMLAGCELEHSWKDNLYTVKTKYPIAIIRYQDGQIKVIEDRQNSL